MSHQLSDFPVNRLRITQRVRPRALLLASIIIPMLFAIFPAVLPAHAAGTLYVTPPSQTPLQAGQTIIYQVKVANMDPFDSWDISVQSDPSILRAGDFTVTGNLFEANFTTTVTEAAHCVDGVGKGCSISDTSGIVHSTAVSNGGAGSGSGLLFTITYTVVVNNGYSSIAIPAAVDFLANKGSTVLHSTNGALYGSCSNCPVAHFTFLPATPAAGDRVTFNASSSFDPNPGAKIVTYAWTISGGRGPPIQGQNRPVLVQTFNDNGTFTITLQVTDNLGLTSLTTKRQLDVSFKIFHNLVVNSILASATDDIVAGTPITITAEVYNRGTVPESRFNLTIYLDGQPFRTFDYSGVGIVPLYVLDRSFRLDTTGLQPGSYIMVASIQPSNSTNRSPVLGIRIIAPYQGSPIPFTMPQFIGLVVGVLAAVGVVRWVIVRSRAKQRLLAQELS